MPVTILPSILLPKTGLQLDGSPLKHARLRPAAETCVAIRLEANATSNKKLLVAPGLTTRNKKLLGGGHRSQRFKET